MWRRPVVVLRHNGVKFDPVDRGPRSIARSCTLIVSFFVFLLCVLYVLHHYSYSLSSRISPLYQYHYLLPILQCAFASCSSCHPPESSRTGACIYLILGARFQIPASPSFRVLARSSNLWRWEWQRCRAVPWRGRKSRRAAVNTRHGRAGAFNAARVVFLLASEPCLFCTSSSSSSRVLPDTRCYAIIEPWCRA